MKTTPTQDHAVNELVAALKALLAQTFDRCIADGFVLTDQEEATRQQAMSAIANATNPQPPTP